MRYTFLMLALCLGVGKTFPTDQKPLIATSHDTGVAKAQTHTKERALQGRFLHITGMACFNLRNQNLTDVYQTSILTNSTDPTLPPTKTRPATEAMAQLASMAPRPPIATLPYPSSMLHFNGSTTTSRTRLISSYGRETLLVTTAT